MIYFIGNGTGKVKIGYSMDPEIEKAIDKLESKIYNLNDERDFELEKIDRKYDGNGYEVAK
jgi:hypothetical protein